MNQMNQSETVVDALRKQLDELIRFKVAVEQVFNHVVITDKDETILFANQAAQTMTGYSQDELLGKTPRVWGGQMGKEFYLNMWKILTVDKQPFKAQVKNRKKDGELYYAIVTITPLINPQGEIQGYVGVEENVNDLKTVDIFFETSHELMCIANAQGYFEKINGAFESMLGYTKSEILEHPFVYHIHNEDQAATKKEMEKLAKGIKTINFVNRYRKKDGGYIWLEWNATPQEGKIFATARNVTKEREVDRMKTEFISLASHQLRTPLTATKWFLERLANGEGGSLTDAQKELISKTNQSNEQTIALVNSLLNISRIESGRIIIDKESVDLVKLYKDVSEEARLKYLEKKQPIIEEVNDQSLLVPTDAKLVRNVLINLLTNALKYSPNGRSVKFALYRENDQAVFRITDNGYGIPKMEQSKLFTKFFRSQNIVKIETEGTGLGLYLAKQITESLGGAIRFESEENKGTTFWFSLPLTGTKQQQGEVALVT